MSSCKTVNLQLNIIILSKIWSIVNALIKIYISKMAQNIHSKSKRTFCTKVLFKHNQLNFIDKIVAIVNIIFGLYTCCQHCLGLEYFQHLSFEYFQP